jgi:hypothetical protein
VSSPSSSGQFMQERLKAGLARAGLRAKRLGRRHPGCGHRCQRCLIRVGHDVRFGSAFFITRFTRSSSLATRVRLWFPTVLFWQHHIGLALAAGLLPPILTSAIVLWWADLRPYRDSALGRYVGRFMSRRVEAARLTGLLPLWGGAWLQQWPLVAVGVLWIAGCWLWGLRRPSSGPGKWHD